MLAASPVLADIDKGLTQVFPLAFFWWLYVVSGVTALRYLTVPMYRCAGCLQLRPLHNSSPELTHPVNCSVLRRATTFLVVGGEYIAFGKAPSLGGLVRLAAVLWQVAGLHRAPHRRYRPLSAN